MHRHHIVIFLFAAATLAACSQVSTGPYGNRSLDWYKAHLKEAKAEVAWCDKQANPDQVASCKLAGTAVQDVTFDNWLKSNRNVKPQA